MNDVIRLLSEHRSVRKFKAEQIPDLTVTSLVEAGMAAATSSNLQGRTVVRVRDSETRQRISEISGGQAQVVDAPVFLVWCADLHRSIEAGALHGAAGPSGLTEHFLIATVDVALAAQNSVVAAESLGLGTCYIGGIRNDAETVADLLELPDLVYPVFGMTVGWPDESPRRKPRLPTRVVLHEDVYDSTAFREEAGAYDEEMRAHYRARRHGAAGADRLWTRDMANLLGKESRTHMLSFLQGRGFLHR